MTDQTPHVEWHRAPDFAEVAEALGVTTRQIMAVRDPRGDRPYVLYTLTTEPDDTLVHSVHLRRNTDGTLSPDELPTAQPGLWEQVTSEARRQMEGEGGGTL